MFHDYWGFARCTTRSADFTSASGNDIGFRVVLQIQSQDDIWDIEPEVIQRALQNKE